MNNLQLKWDKYLPTLKSMNFLMFRTALMEKKRLTQVLEDKTPRRVFQTEDWYLADGGFERIIFSILKSNRTQRTYKVINVTAINTRQLTIHCLKQLEGICLWREQIAAASLCLVSFYCMWLLWALAIIMHHLSWYSVLSNSCLSCHARHYNVI